MNSDCFLEKNKRQKVFKCTSYHDIRCTHCNTEFKTGRGRNTRVVRTVTNFDGYAMDFMFSCVSCAKVFKESLEG